VRPNICSESPALFSPVEGGMTDVETTPDSDTLRRIAGDVAAVGDLYDLYADDVRRAIAFALGSAAWDDLVLDVFVQASGRMSELQHPPGPRQGLVILAARTATIRAFPPGRPRPTLFGRALATLTPLQRATFLLVDVERIDVATVARALDSSVDLLRMRVEVGRRLLSVGIGQRLGAACGTCELSAPIVCGSCGDHRAQLERLRATARNVEFPQPDDLSIRIERQRVIDAIVRSQFPELRRNAWWILIAALAVGCIIALAVTCAPRHPVVPRMAPPTHVDVWPEPGTTWQYHREANVDVVELAEGRLFVTVPVRREGERFVLRLPDGRVETSMARFDVTVSQRTTMTLRVAEGALGLYRNDLSLDLRSGASWSRFE
jgi:DNA-directed RNA polymerase specialized sigma24 family protein